MFRRKIAVLIVCILACLTVVNACSSTTKEETTKSREKKSKKKAKKDKDKESTKEESKEETAESEEVAETDAEREELKSQLAEALDDFLVSEEPEVFLAVTANGKTSNMSESRLNFEGGTLYYVTMQNADSGQSATIFSDGQTEYLQEDSSNENQWTKNVDYEKYTEQLAISNSYISYLRFIYAALDAGFDYTYSPDENVYIIEADEDKVLGLDFTLIEAKLNNADKLKAYDNKYATTSELTLKAYPKDMGIVRKQYKFLVSDKALEVTEILYDEAGGEVRKTQALKFRIPSAIKNNKETIIGQFNQLKSSDSDN